MTVKEEIQSLKKERNAVIMAHYYVPDEVQEIADYIGDSFYLSKKATTIDADVIVLCGVSFMGESAKILNPEKTVLLPDMNADCAMAHMATVETIQQMREKYDDLAVVCYINSTAELKKHSDVVVTSANALKIVRSLPNKNIFFTPDENLGHFVASKVPEKNFVFNDGRCPIHADLTKEDVLLAKKEHPDALVLMHPECVTSALELADYIGSTSGIIKFASESENKEFIIGTEDGVLFKLITENPDKKFYLASKNFRCPGMKLVTLDKVRDVLKYNTNQVEVNEDLRKLSLLPLEKMLEMAK